MTNLDQLAMQKASALLKRLKNADPSEIENLATNGLGVVLEQGVYAGLLYFYTKRPKKGPDMPKLFVDQFGDLVSGLKLQPPPAHKWDDSLQGLQYVADNICNKLETTIWVKTMWEHTLTYVRYGAKALDKEKKEDKEKTDAPVADRPHNT